MQHRDESGIEYESLPRRSQGVLFAEVNEAD